MARNRGVYVELSGLCTDWDPKKLFDHIAVINQLDSFICVSSHVHNKAYCVFVFALRTTITTAYFSDFAEGITVENSKEVRDRLLLLASLTVEHQYQAYAQGSLLPLWRETLNQEADGKARSFFITIPQFDADINELETHIRAELSEQGNGLEGILIGKEPHEDGMKHTHCFFKCVEACRLNLPRLWGRIGAMGQIQRVIDEARVISYIIKGYSEGSRDYTASGCCALPSSGDKQSFNDVLDELVQLVLHKKTNPWEFLHDKSKAVRLTAFRNRKSLEQLWFDVCRLNAQSRVVFHLPRKPKDKTFSVIWEWMNKLQSGELRNPKNPSRHLFLSGTTGTRKSNFASMLSRSFNTFHFDVNDEYYDGYVDGKDLGICDEFHVDKPGKGKDLPNLNRFLEGASGQLLNIKYQKGVKCDTTLPCLFISNLTKEKVVDLATKYFDIEIVKAFLRRFTFVDIKNKALPADFTLIGNNSSETSSVETQTDEEYYPPFMFTSPVSFDHLSTSTYLAIPWDGREELLNCCKLEPEFRSRETLDGYKYIIVSKNKQAKNTFTNPFNSVKALIVDSASILKTVSVEPWTTETEASYVAANGDDVDDKYTNCSLFPPCEHFDIAVVRYRNTKPLSSWIDPMRFYCIYTSDGRSRIIVPPTFIVYDIGFSAESTLRGISHRTRTLGDAMTQFKNGLGVYLAIVANVSECAICQETTKEQGVVLACSHAFHLRCFIQLLHSKFENCPLCKATGDVMLQMQQLSTQTKVRCFDRECVQCVNPWSSDQNIVGCICDHCQKTRRDSARVFGNS